jgi:hypothetical protein
MAINEETTGPGNRPLIWSLAVGIALGIPAGHLLAYLVALPAFLGLFFFLWLGLVIGAAMFRLGKAAVPAPKQSLYVIGLTVSVLAWMSGLVSEYRMLPGEVADAVRRNSVTQSASRDQIQQFEQKVRGEVLDHLRKQYPPGGLVGYWRWRTTDGSMKFARMGDGSLYPYEIRQRGIIWLVRVILSLVLISFTILSQFLGLARLPSKVDADSVATEDPIQSS